MRMRRDGSFLLAEAARRATGPSGGRGGLAGFAVQVAHRVGQLRALLDPVVHALGVQHDALLGTLRDRVVIAHALDVAAVARAARVGHDDVVEGALLGAAAGEADLDHGGSGVAQSPGWRGKPAILAKRRGERNPSSRRRQGPAPPAAAAGWPAATAPAGAPPTPPTPPTAADARPSRPTMSKVMGWPGTVSVSSGSSHRRSPGTAPAGLRHFHPLATRHAGRDSAADIA